MPRLIWSGPANRDLDAIERYLTDFDPRLAADTITEIIAASSRLAEFPRIGSPKSGGRRSRVVGGTPYRIVYKVGRDVDILRIRHVRQNWRR